MQYSLIPACGILVRLIITMNTKKKTPGIECLRNAVMDLLMVSLSVIYYRVAYICLGKALNEISSLCDRQEVKTFGFFVLTFFLIQINSEMSFFSLWGFSMLRHLNSSQLKHHQLFLPAYPSLFIFSTQNNCTCYIIKLH